MPYPVNTYAVRLGLFVTSRTNAVNVSLITPGTNLTARMVNTTANGVSDPRSTISTSCLSIVCPFSPRHYERVPGRRVFDLIPLMLSRSLLDPSGRCEAFLSSVGNALRFARTATVSAFGDSPGGSRSYLLMIQPLYTITSYLSIPYLFCSCPGVDTYIHRTCYDMIYTVLCSRIYFYSLQTRSPSRRTLPLLWYT